MAYTSLYDFSEIWKHIIYDLSSLLMMEVLDPFLGSLKLFIIYLKTLLCCTEETDTIKKITKNFLHVFYTFSNWVFPQDLLSYF